VLILLTLVDRAVELLWFRSLDFEPVFWRLLLLKVTMFAGAFIVVFAWLLLNLNALDRRTNLVGLFGAGSIRSRTAKGRPSSGSRRPERAFVPLCAAAAAIFGLGYYSQWDRLLRVVWAQDVGSVDPVYHRDIGFYLFVLPFLNAVQGGMLLVALGSFALVAAGYVATGALQVSARGQIIVADDRVLGHLVAAGVALLAVWGWGFYLDRYDLLTRSSGAVFGAGYADVHATLPGLWVALGATLALIVALVWFAATKARHLILYSVVGYLLLLASCLILVPGGLQRFTVEPNELELEMPFLQYNIAATRAAYGLDKVGISPYPSDGALDPARLRDNQATIDNIRIWDDRPLSQTFRQLQQIRTYYSFGEVNVDRYVIDGQYRQVMLAARELAGELPGKGSGWVNRRLQYTHGYGLAMCLAAEKDEQGGPVFTVADLPPRSRPDLPITRPEIYFGSRTTDYAIVPTGVKELDYPQGDQNVYTSYGGHGGVLLDAFWKRTLFTVFESDTSILLSGYLSPQSRIQFWRQTQERILKSAPFLKLDRDPYLVIDQGQLFWIQDAYTTAEGYPYAEATADGFSYIRNSLKVVVDAYDGDLGFYVIDAADPVLRAYRAAFPALFRPIEAMPAGLRRHLRYPRDLFEIQVDKFAIYHMTVPQVFYNREDVWAAPKERYGGDIVAMEPYYVLMKLPGEDRLQFLLMTPVTPNNRDNMIAWLAARSDEPGYGELVAYKLSKDRLILGPLQVEATIDQDTTISRQLSLWDQHGSHVIRGNLLVIPIDHTFLYVEPVFLLAEGTNIPQLKRVIVGDGTRLAMESSLAGALQVVFGGRPPSAEDGAAHAEAPVPGASEAFTRADQALRQGDWAAFGREWQRLKTLLER
jgi:uncharacterized protein